MAAITPVISYQGELAGEKQVIGIVAVPGSASDTIDLSSVCSNIDIVVGSLSAGLDAALTDVQVSGRGTTTITIASFEQDGTAATDWTGAEVNIMAIVSL